MTTELDRKNRRMMMVAAGIVVGMLSLSFASVPLYRLFCQVTGFGGSTQMVEKNPHTGTYDRVFTIRFNADVVRGMPWRFKPEIRQTEVRVGQDGIVSFVAENNGDTPIVGTAIYNVTPPKAGKYFYKTECFCFGEQRLAAGERTHMPVTFFVDPEIMNDRELRDLDTITLSYTFFRHNSEDLQDATDAFMAAQEQTIN